ncbi:MAG: rhomboid family intramembrane serine protease [Blastocatellia bacterium]|nr:rhomboid family intramembrane serine protease [Blastocatellia bacterium]
MIPLRDNIPSRTFPFVTVTLIVINVLAFIFELMLGPKLNGFLREFAVVPRHFFSDYYITASGGLRHIGLADLILPLFTSMFLHGGWAHVIGNMLYLWIFGDNVEDRMGHVKYLFFYLLCGMAASGAHILTNQESRVPSLGASGAIAGVLGAYLILYPKARVLVVLPLFIFWQIIEVPAFFFLGFWIVQQFIYGVGSLSESAQTGGVAWWAHIGGFAAGLLMVKLLARPERRVLPEVWDPDEYRYR